MKVNEWLKMKKSSFVEGTIIATLSVFIVKILGMLYVIPFYAIIGKNGSALYAYAYSIYVMFLDISTAGIPLAISKIINEYHTLGMEEAKVRAYKISKKVVSIIAISIFLLLFIFAEPIGKLIIGSLEGGNTYADVASVIRLISLAILVVPFYSITKGFLQGHNIINISSVSNVIEQVVRIAVILIGSYLSICILHTDYRVGVKIAVLGAFIGGIAAYGYILYKMRNDRKNLGLEETKKKDKVTDKEIVKKIFSYAIPFIIINTIASIYGFTDMLSILRMLDFLGFKGTDVEFIATSITTWAPKIGMVITSVAMGMTVSLIPTIVNAFTLKKWDEVANKLNKALQMIIFISIPMAIGLTVLAKPVWTIFYGASDVGTLVLSISVWASVALNFYMITGSTLQSLNKFKLVYFSGIVGFVVNLILNIVLMYLFSKTFIPAFFGAVVSTIIGYLLSSFIALHNLHKNNNITYGKTVKIFLRCLVPNAVMLVVILAIRLLIPITSVSKLVNVLYVALVTVIGAVTYFAIAYKMGLIEEILGKGYFNKIIKKLTPKSKN